MPHRRYRPRDRLPTWLLDRVLTLAGDRGHNASMVWHWGSIQAAADVRDHLAWRESHQLPPPSGWWDGEDQWSEVRWTQTEREEKEHLELIEGPGGSSRTAVLICTAARYLAVGGDLVGLMQRRPPGPWVCADPRRAEDVVL